ncbi:MAG TPA: transposase [Xanthomonadaceae bacterium]|nr:transposase [Xanthomonadaceae bacterium]
METPSQGHRGLRKGRVSVPGQVYLLTLVTQHRIPRFQHFVVGSGTAKAIAEFDLTTDHRIPCWVLMPDHFHALLELGTSEPLDRAVHRLKFVMARAANRCLKRHGRLWARAFHDHALRRDEDLVATARYIVANPVRAGLVRRVGDYPFWDAVWLAGAV